MSNIMSLNDRKCPQVLVSKVVESLKHTTGSTVRAYPGRIN